MADVATWLLSACAFAVSMSATPGPNNTMITASGANFGFARSLPHMTGVAVGFSVMLLAVALGGGDVLRAYPAVHGVLRWVGAAYLVWLAFKVATAQPVPRGQGPSTGKPLTFLQAALFQWVNPKAWIIALGGIATYTTAAGGAVTAQAVGLAAVFLLVTFPCQAFWALTGVGAARLLRTARGLRLFNYAMAALLIASLATLLPEMLGSVVDRR